jgi:putative transposase
MTMPRSSYVNDDEIGVYHCFCRCVRRAFLCGVDPLTHRDFSHRKSWIVDRLRFLASIFAIDVCAYAVLANHYHSILRTRPDIAASWSDSEVAARWLMLFPPRSPKKHPPELPSQLQISSLALCSDRIAVLRRRLSNLSWFMARLNEFIARAANKEDNLTGRFWESRFKAQALLDDPAIVACMVYVDLNPIRAGIANSPELSDFTSIQQRIRDWYRDSSPPQTTLSQPAQIATSDPLPTDASPQLNPGSTALSALPPANDWLCPIQSDPLRLGILQMSAPQYFDLVDKSGRFLHRDKPGAIDPNLAPILLRIGANPHAWIDTISRFSSKFRLAAGMLPNLRNFASRLGRRWLSGVSSARDAFTVSPAQSL